ncbi:hypothetical protein CMO94_02820 [Candidatus Woesearchaeota archaeon]|nr:hypothetical protein [Candidatus Woesearchaeota archaeon]
MLIAAVFSYQILYASYIDLNITPDIDTLTETGLESKTVSEKSFLAKVLLPEGEWIWGTSTFLIYVVPFFFFLNALIFIPIGQLLGEKMKKFPPLKAYTIDISGSLAGIFALSALSFFSVQPIWWFLFGFIIYLRFLTNFKSKAIGIVFFAISLVFIGLLGSNTFWSPYYKIIMEEPNKFGEFTLTVNDDNILTSVNFSRFENIKNHYILPYLFKQPKNVLIVGAGTGNDVYVASLNNVPDIDAVEIDPTIISFADFHPNKPYDDSNVNVIVNDARNYIKTTDKKYDMVVYGLLDSHRVFAQQSSVRLDNLVYTKEAMEETKKILKNDSVVALSFWVGKDFIETKIFNLLKSTFDLEPLVIKTGSVKTFIVGEDVKKIELPYGLPYTQIKDIPVIVPSDNYPFLYLKNKLKDTSYIRILIIILLITFFMLMFLTSGFKSLSWHFFFLGAGFLLIETKSITEMALMFGSTWIINSFVIGGILIMILFANYYVSTFKINIKHFYLFLLLSIVINFLMKPSSFLQDALIFKIIAILIVSSPVFFAGVIFATSFKKIKDIPNRFGSNILGAVLGGALEYSSLLFGIKGLYIIAFVTYILSYILIRR